MVDELYNIAVEEDEIREKMTETDSAIKELQELLEATKARIEHRQKYKREVCITFTAQADHPKIRFYCIHTEFEYLFTFQLEERETYLRKRRMDLLKGTLISQKPAFLLSASGVHLKMHAFRL